MPNESQLIEQQHNVAPPLACPADASPPIKAVVEQLNQALNYVAQQQYLMSRGVMQTIITGGDGDDALRILTNGE